MAAVIADQRELVDLLDKLSADAAKLKVEAEHDRGMHATKQEYDAAVDANMSKYRSRLYSLFNYESIKDDPKKQVGLLNWKPNDVRSFLLTDSNPFEHPYTSKYSPYYIQDQKDYSKVKPYLHGQEGNEGTDWWNLNKDMLEAEGKRLGYAGYDDFMDDIKKYQIAKDRGEILAEMHGDPLLSLFGVAFPSAYEEAEKQIATGTGTESDLMKQAAIDFGANTLMTMTPAMRTVRGSEVPFGVAGAADRGVVKATNMLNPAYHIDNAFGPLVGGVASAAEQGLVEAARQEGKTLVDDELKPDWSMPVAATMAGLTRPAAVAGASGLVRQGTGETTQQFGRGLAAASRAGNPVYNERNDIIRRFGVFDRARGEQMAKAAGNTDAQGAFVATLGMPLNGASIRDWSRDKSIKETLKLLDVFGVDTKRGKALMQARLDDVLYQYDNMMGNTFMDAAQKAGYEQVIPAKMAELMGASPAYNRGVRVGEGIADVAGRIEPAFKVTPGGMKTGIEQMVGLEEPKPVDTYKVTPWYLEMDDQKRQAFDDAYKRTFGVQ